MSPGMIENQLNPPNPPATTVGILVDTFVFAPLRYKVNIFRLYRALTSSVQSQQKNRPSIGRWAFYVHLHVRMFFMHMQVYC